MAGNRRRPSGRPKSAKTGKFVTVKYAVSHPATVVWQRIKRKKK